MSVIGTFYRSTVGKKVVVALTGAALFLFVIGHMVGNLKVFGGFSPATGIHKLDYYAEFLRSFGSDLVGYGNFLWISRGGLLLCLLLHIVTVAQLNVRNIQSRQEDYVVTKRVASSIPAQTMMYGGILILLFVIFHIFHFTTGDLHFHGFVHGRVYANVYNAFQHWFIVLIYIVGVGAVSMHLYHGLWSVTQTLGLDSPSRNKAIRCGAKALAVIILLGFLAVPVSVQLGIVPEPSEATLTSVGH